LNLKLERGGEGLVIAEVAKFESMNGFINIFLSDD
jgi:hypothetical protein